MFESFKCVEGSIYNLNAHLRRLEVSCSAIGLSLPIELNALREVVVQTVRAGEHEDALVRLLVSRGPGTMGIGSFGLFRRTNLCGSLSVE